MKILDSVKDFFKKDNSSDGEEKSFPWKQFFIGLIGLVVVLFCASLIWVYAMPGVFGERGMALRQKMPFPLVFIAPSTVITYGDFNENTRAVKQFYQNQDFSEIGLRVDFTTEEGKKRFLVRQKDVLNKMIEDQALEKIASDNGITVTKEMAREGIRRSFDEFGTSESVQKDLKRLYGWDLSTFEEKIVTPKLYQEKIQELFQSQEKPRVQAEDKIKQAKKALDEGKMFSDVAKQFSEGSTKENGGELGWFQASDLTSELQTIVPSQTKGAPGSIIESELGFHIVLVEETKKEGDIELYRISQIFTKKELFSDWLDKEMQDMSVFILSPEYRWNKDDAQVEFKSESMHMFEKDMFKKSDGDAMLLF
jgi:parvulin-like peptidyl-prolyl isomerase